MFDGSRLAFDENVDATCRLVATARARDPGIAFEAELGVIGGREDTTPEAALAGRTTPDEAARFVAATDIDVLAPNLGNLHRMPDDSTELDLAADRRHRRRDRPIRSRCTAARASTRRSSAPRSPRASARSTSRRA